MGFRNAGRGLKINGTNFTYLTEGAYGIIFVDREQKRIRKIYRNRVDSGLSHSSKVFQSEVDAYAIANGNAELRQLTPAFFGAVTNQVIVDGTGRDVTNEFYADLAFEAEFVDGDFAKSVTAPQDEQDRVFDLFRKHGISHTVDASVINQDGRIAKVIDFATVYVELMWND